MKKILIVSAVNTGGGHKSIARCLTEELDRCPDIEYRLQDGFDLMSRRAQRLLADSYGPMTRYIKQLYAAGYNIVERLPQLSNITIRKACEWRFMQLVRDYHPDMILTVHPLFVGSILSPLRENGVDIPFVVHQADFESISATWFDPRSDLNITLTDEAYEYTLSRGIPAEKIMRNRFPVRAQVTEYAKTAPEKPRDRIRNVLLMSGAEGSGKLVRVVETLLSETDKYLTVIAGRNHALRNRLYKIEDEMKTGRLEILGFVGDVEKYIAWSDVMVMRASPNSVMEACAMGRPIIAIDALPGQEERNPDFVVRHGLGVVERDVEKLPDVLASLEADGGEKMRAICRAQAAYFDPDSACRTVEALRALMGDGEYDIKVSSLKMKYMGVKRLRAAKRAMKMVWKKMLG